MERLKYIINLLIIALLIGAIAISKDNRLLGKSTNETSSKDAPKTTQTSIEEQLPDGTLIINSTTLADDIIGFGGKTPIKLYVKDDIIQKVEILDNVETPSFFKQVVESGLPSHWDNMPIEEAATSSVDVVSGATYSSDALIKNVQRAATYVAKVENARNNPFSNLGVKDFAGILVIFFGVAVTFIRPKNKIYELVQMALNVIVLGFWCGSFLSLAQFVSWMSNGINLSVSLVSALLLVVVIFVPLFGKKGSYCHIHCPMGSAQELLNRVPSKKVKLGVKTNKFLNNLRYYILVALLFMMWIGVGFSIMDYEVFSAFIVESASTTVLVMAVVFLLLSVFIPRPYCRFVCPTGALITMSQKCKE